MANGDKIPCPPCIPKGEKGAENACPVVFLHLYVFHMNMIDSLRKVPDKSNLINALPQQMARIIIQPESRPVFKKFEQSFCRIIVEGDLRRMDLQGECNPAGIKYIKIGVQRS